MGALFTYHTDPINGKLINILSSLNKQDKQAAANRKKFYKSNPTFLMAGENLNEDSHQRLIEIFKFSPVLEKVAFSK